MKNRVEANLSMGRSKLRSFLVMIVFATGATSLRPGVYGQDLSPGDLGGASNGSQSGINMNRDVSPYYPDLQTNNPNVPRSTPSGGVNLQSDPSNNPGTTPSSANGNNAAQRDLNLLPPDPPSEFQRMVANSTGKMLPIYGARLFRNAPSTFAPLDRVPVTPDYVIGPGDELLIQVWGQVTLNSRFTVDRTGNIYVPQVGTLRVAGLQFAQLQEYLKVQMSKVFRNFDLNVNMGQLRSIQIFVVGQARRPGSYTVSSLSTLVNALFVTGGPTPQGSLRHIQLKRSGQVQVDFDLYDLLQRGDKSKDLQLLPGDVIYIPPVGAQVAVAGSVNTPAIYELKSATDSTVGDVLALASGVTPVTLSDTARLERVDEHKMRSVTDLTLDSAGRASAVRDGDILELVAIVNRYKDAVTLRGNVANPGRYGWRPGMRVGDLFPDKSALITRDYWLKHGRLGQPTLTYLPVCRSTTSPDSATDYSIVVPGGATGEGPGSSDAGFNRSAVDCIPASSNRENELDAYGRNASTYQSGQGTSTEQSASQSNGNTIRTAGATQQTGPSNARASSAGAAIEGSGQFEQRNDVKLSEPDIDWSYAVIERQSKDTLTTSLLPFNLGRIVLDGDSSQNLELLPGDVVTIFSKSDIRVPQAQQTRLVRIEGEFASSGVYSALPGETLRDLVKRAGGFTADAYLYGSQFTRESTRRLQQQRLNEYIDEISLRANTNAANTAGRNVNALDAAAAVAAQSQNQNVISSLRQARSSGRIVLDLHPDSNSVAALPAIPLEDGDTFIVPHVPSMVSVAGAVYNPNSFLYNPDRRVSDYLRQAGGANRDADAKRAYVIRADGSVISKQQISALRRNGFESLRVYPGDTVVVPLNLNKGTTLRNIVDIAQIVGQFGIAIAAASIVF